VEKKMTVEGKKIPHDCDNHSLSYPPKKDCRICDLGLSTWETNYEDGSHLEIFKVADDRLWRRSMWAERYGNPGEVCFWVAEDDIRGQIKCICWADAGFDLEYGTWEIIATCRACGAKDSVYQG
jgi:hypothetical protein